MDPPTAAHPSGCPAQVPRPPRLQIAYQEDRELRMKGRDAPGRRTGEEGSPRTGATWSESATSGPSASFHADPAFGPSYSCKGAGPRLASPRLAGAVGCQRRTPRDMDGLARPGVLCARCTSSSGELGRTSVRRHGRALATDHYAGPSCVD